MRTLFLSAAIAIVLHALLFSVGAEWSEKKVVYSSRKAPISLSIDYINPATREAPSLSGDPERQPAPIRKEPENPFAGVRPTLKKSKVKKTPIPSWEDGPKTSDPERTTRKYRLREPLSHSEGTNIDLGTPKEAPEGIDTGLTFPAETKADEARALQSLRENSSRRSVPLYRQNPAPAYPVAAIRRKYEGSVLLEVLVNREGKVDQLHLLQSSGYSVLDEAAIEAVRGWSFEPAAVGDEKVEMWVKVPVLFHLK